MDYESINCGQLDRTFIGKSVSAYGWCRRIRDHGGKLFIDMGDRFGETQLVFESQAKELADKLGKEYVIQAFGKVKKRDEDTVDRSIATGGVEIFVEKFEVVSTSLPLPFELIDEKSRSLANEDLRMKFRYLDLRRRQMIKNIEFRDIITKQIRKYFWDNGFMELETPTLVKDTYETGSRTFIVPSRLSKNAYYSLAQSPQLYKQLCMVGGIDKYFQIARCYRDEDQRIDRQPEFTQVDIEVSFRNEEYIKCLIEELIKAIFKQALHNDTRIDFPVLQYKEAMEKYGSDKPDLRFDSMIFDITGEMKSSGYNVLKRIIESKGFVKAAAFPADFSANSGGSRLNKQYMLKLIETAKGFGLKGLTWLYAAHGKIESDPMSISESIGSDVCDSLMQKMRLRDGDIIIIGSDLSERLLLEALGKLRKLVGDKLQKYNKEYAFAWITDFPLFDKDEVTGKLKPAHNPFTAPTKDTEKYLDSEPEKVIARQYDIVLNGEEIGGGSIRIHDPELQKKSLSVIGMDQSAISSTFGFLIDALSYGAPIHGGIALGLDRFISMLFNSENIRDFILFPKNHKQESLLDSAPTKISKKRLLSDYNIKQEDIE
ncbi:MAG: aspartate--tRNA ligase [Candidatus Marsarchaeota archaeon]|nr:aspartate--tRNA ligase [Candidatus Marsarchaeota archaeon]MCL5106396.1 aspartate--tRNA ligase [Candidatus Marsarchaeota archaeon]